MAPRLFDFLNKPKYQILYYILRYGNISTNNSKNAIAAAFGYKSPGHFYKDFDDLLKDKLIIEKNKQYMLTKEGKKEVSFYSSLMTGFSYTLIVGLLFIYYYIVSLFGVIIPNIIYLVSFFIMILLSYIFIKGFNTFKPNLPDTIKELEK